MVEEAKVLIIIIIGVTLYPSLFWIRAAFREELECGETLHPKATAQVPCFVSVHLGYDHRVFPIKRCTYFLIDRSQSLAVATP